MNDNIILIHLTISFIFLIANIFVIRPYINKSDRELEKIKLIPEMTGLDFAKSFFGDKVITKNISSASGIYQTSRNRVVLSKSAVNKIDFHILATVLHEYKHKKDRLILMIGQGMLIFIVAIIPIMTLINFSIEFKFLLLLLIISLVIRLIGELSAISYAEKKVFNYIKNISTLKNKIILRQNLIIRINYIIGLSLLYFVMGCFLYTIYQNR